MYLVGFVFRVVYLDAFCLRDWNRNMHFLKAVKAVIAVCLQVFFISSGNAQNGKHVCLMMCC